MAPLSIVEDGDHAEASPVTEGFGRSAAVPGPRSACAGAAGLPRPKHLKMPAGAGPVSPGVRGPTVGPVRSQRR